MILFTGSTRSGIAVAKNAADTVKRVTQELAGKSPDIILRDADLTWAASKYVESCLGNSGQSCNAPTRILAPRKRQVEVLFIALHGVCSGPNAEACAGRESARNFSACLVMFNFGFTYNQVKVALAEALGDDGEEGLGSGAARTSQVKPIQPEDLLQVRRASRTTTLTNRPTDQCPISQEIALWTYNQV